MVVMLVPHLQCAVFAGRYQLRLVCAYVDGLPADARDESSVALEYLATQFPSGCIP